MILEEYDCEVSSFFFTDPSEHSYCPESDISITNLSYSLSLDIAAVTFSNGRAGYLSSNDYFRPGTVHALLAPNVRSATCASINPRYHLLVFGTEEGEIMVYTLNYDNGLLNLSHKVVGLTDWRDGGNTPDKTRIQGVFWTPDGCCLCATYASGNIYMWSVYGTFLYSCALPTTHGCWDAEGYNMWAVSGVQVR